MGDHITWSVMHKKKKIVFALLLLLLVGVGVWLLLAAPRRAPMQVVGTLTPKEVTEITSAVHRQMWRSTFSAFSWKAIPGLPGSIAGNVTSHISGIYGDSESALV